MTGRSAAARAIAVFVLPGTVALPPAAAEPFPDGRPAAPVTAEHRYRLSAAIRPFFFWVGAGLQARGRYLFKLNRARVEDGTARAEATTLYAPQDYTFRELGELLRFADEAKATPGVRTGRLPPGTRPGLLFALADLVGAGVVAGCAPGSAGPLPRKVQFTFNAGVYDLVVTSWERVERARYGSRTYNSLVRLEFESRNLEKGTTERFVLACGTDGPLAGVPVFVRYQPKWWFKVEGVLDEEETL
jgi:hypothetical protein